MVVGQTDIRTPMDSVQTLLDAPEKSEGKTRVSFKRRGRAEGSWKKKGWG